MARRSIRGKGSSERDEWPTDPAEQVARLSEFFETDLRPHFEAEEACVFPVAARTLPDGEALVGALLADHRTLEARWKAFPPPRSPGRPQRTGNAGSPPSGNCCTHTSTPRSASSSSGCRRPPNRARWRRRGPGWRSAAPRPNPRRRAAHPATRRATPGSRSRRRRFVFPGRSAGPVRSRSGIPSGTPRPRSGPRRPLGPPRGRSPRRIRSGAGPPGGRIRSVESTAVPGAGDRSRDSLRTLFRRQI